MDDKEYTELRERVLEKYRKLCKDSLAMDLCEVDDATRIRMLKDPVYLRKAKAMKAKMFEDQLDHIDEVLAGTYGEEGKDQSATILKALEMRNKLLLDDINAGKDETSALNVTFTAMEREDFLSLETVEVNQGSNNSTELGVDFGTSDETDSFESRMKREVKEKMKNQQDTQ